MPISSNHKGKAGEKYVAFLLTRLGIDYSEAGEKYPELDGFIKFTFRDVTYPVGVQVKSGPSHTTKAGSGRFKYHETRAQRLEWSRYDFPVLLCWCPSVLDLVPQVLWAVVAGPNVSAERTSIRLDSSLVIDRHFVECLRAIVLPLHDLLVEVVSTAQLATPNLCNSQGSSISRRMAHQSAWTEFVDWREAAKRQDHPLFGCKIDLTRESWKHLAKRTLKPQVAFHSLSLLAIGRFIVDNAEGAQVRRKLTDGMGNYLGHIVNFYGFWAPPHRRPTHLRVTFRVAFPSAMPAQGQATNVMLLSVREMVKPLSNRERTHLVLRK
jgi:hypothetical protein